MTFRVALTFDAEHPDRPHRTGGTERVLDALAADGRHGHVLRAGTVGRGVPGARPRRSPTRGHLIGNHSFYHARMPLLSNPGLATDVRAAERAIVTATGVDPRPWFRCPFGAGTDDPRVRAGIERLGYREILLGRGRRSTGARARRGTWHGPPDRRGRGARAVTERSSSSTRGRRPRVAACARSSPGCATPAPRSCGWTRLG